MRVRDATSLPDKDGFGRGRSDPYIRIIATDAENKKHTRTTSVKDGTHNPIWEEDCTFGYGSFSKLEIQTKDSDGFSSKDDTLLPTKTISISPSTCTQFFTICNDANCRRRARIQWTTS